MEYILKHFDTPLLRFTANADSADPEYRITWFDEAHRKLLPGDINTVSEEELDRWIRHRTIPKNRAHVHDLLAKCGLNINRPMKIVAICKGLSLNDCYWVTTEDSGDTFDRVNLYDNPISNVLASLVFTGYGSSIRSSLLSSPEFTTNGMLPKCWRRIGGKIYLYKGGTSGASNTGNEPYSEFYAAQIAEVMGITAVPYNLSKWKNILCSTCELFTSKDYAYMPVGRIIRSGGMRMVREYYRSLGEPYISALNDMFLFDAVICNTDRHFENFGFLVDNHTNEIVAPAPLFDHGNSLFNLAGYAAWESDEALEKYAATLRPSVYDDFIEEARAVLTVPRKEKLRHLLEFRFRRHSRYNLPAKRLTMIEKQVRKRAAMLLE
ncbi:MAG: XRE family transcriptional regulator [Ruminococcaceae bacterium]|nr:XRE family transcriptional regulator [Oscillospiraceae bacterium]